MAVRETFVLSTPFNESCVQLPPGRSRMDDLIEMLRRFFKPLVCMFVLTAFLYVLITCLATPTGMRHFA